MPADRSRLVFFLGGHDLEMLTIRALLEAEVPGRLHDRGLAWGAKASDYAAEIRTALGGGQTPVLIELHDDMTLPADRCVVIDHHGERAGKDRPTALHQVFALLALPPARWPRHFDLVAANDRGHIAAMLALDPPASPDEVADIRRRDRAAQGVGLQEEADAERAVASARVLTDGRLTVVEWPHAHTSPVADRMEPALGGPGYVNLAVLSPAEVNVFGQGPVVEALAREFPAGWYGGSLPERGFWGHRLPLAGVADVVAHLCQVVRSVSNGGPPGFSVA